MRNFVDSVPSLVSKKATGCVIVRAVIPGRHVAGAVFDHRDGAARTYAAGASVAAAGSSLIIDPVVFAAIPSVGRPVPIISVWEPTVCIFIQTPRSAGRGCRGIVVDVSVAAGAARRMRASTISLLASPTASSTPASTFSFTATKATWRSTGLFRLLVDDVTESGCCRPAACRNVPERSGHLWRRSDAADYRRSRRQPV